MRVRELIRFGFPESVVKRWEVELGETLLPLQVKALKDFGLLEGQNLVVCSPTASGKTFVGEMAAVHHALHGRKAIYLVPLKALAKEKYRTFCDRYGDYGIRIVLSTRDHRDSDKAIMRGEFELAVLVYEKMLRLLAESPRLVDDLRLVVVDELQMVGDPTRGSDLELLLTCLKSAQPARQVVALSAALPNCEEFARWLDARPLSHSDRQVELRQGVLYKGRFEFRVASKYEYGEETIASGSGDTPDEILLVHLKEMAARNEPCLIFARSRETTRQMAKKLAGLLHIRSEVPSDLDALPPTRSRELLLECMKGGVAFHNADLTDREREVVEESFREKRVMVLVATSTLAMGLNLPAANVFLDPEKWNYDPRWDLTWKESISRADFANMGGRAGRPESPAPYGRAIFLAETEYSRDTLWQRYVESEPEPVTSALWAPGAENTLLSTLAISDSHPNGRAEDLLNETLFAVQDRETGEHSESQNDRLEAALARLRADGLAAESDEPGKRLAPFGCAVATSGIRVETALAIKEFLESFVERGGFVFESDAHRVRFLASVCHTPDGRSLLVPMGRMDWDPIEELDLRFGVELNEISACLPGPAAQRRRGPSEYRIARVVLLLMDWRAGLSVQEIEQRHKVYLGCVITAAHQAAWLISSAGRIAEVVHDLSHRDGWTKWSDRFAGEIERGLPYSCRPWWNSLDCELSRDDIMRLMHAGITRPEDLTLPKLEVVSDSISRQGLGCLKKFRDQFIEKIGASQGEATSETNSDDKFYDLEFDSSIPLTITFCGSSIRLQEKEFRLLEILAENAGQCVPYDAIYDRLWGDIVVEPGQINHHKAKLLKKLGESKTGEHIIETIPRHGFRLLLDPERVNFRTGMLEPVEV